MRTWTSALVIVLVACVGGGRTEGQSGDGPRLARGAEVFKEQKCQACHSIAGVGSKRYPLDTVGSRRSEEEIRTWITAPREMNPKVSKRAYDKLPKADLDALVAYLKTLRSS